MKKKNKKQKTKNLGAESEFLAIINNFLKKIANVNVPFVAILWLAETLCVKKNCFQMRNPAER